MKSMDKQSAELAPTAPHNAFIGSGASAHTMKEVSVITGKNVPSDISTGSAVKDTVKAPATVESVSRMSGGETPVILNQVLQVPEDEHRLIPMSGLCDDDYTVDLKSKKCNMKKRNCAAGVGEHADGMFPVNLL